MTSVLINNYNNGPWLRACIDSVLTQTQAPEEIVVYDDGSTDDSLRILQACGERIRVIAGRREPGRLAVASQANAVAEAFRVAKGNHLYLLDGDDLFLPDKIRRYEEAWSACPDASLVQAPAMLIDQEGRFQRDGYEHLKHPADGDFKAATYRTQDTDLYYPTSALAFSRAYLERMLPLDYTNDIELAADNRLAALAPFFGPVVVMNDSLTQWRQRPASISRSGSQRDPLSGTLRRYRYFNRSAVRLGLQPLQLWRNPRFWRQAARRVAPRWLAAPFVHNPAGQRPSGPKA